MGDNMGRNREASCIMVKEVNKDGMNSRKIQKKVFQGSPRTELLKTFAWLQFQIMRFLRNKLYSTHLNCVVGYSLHSFFPLSLIMQSFISYAPAPNTFPPLFSVTVPSGIFPVPILFLQTSNWTPPTLILSVLTSYKTSQTSKKMSLNLNPFIRLYDLISTCNLFMNWRMQR